MVKPTNWGMMLSLKHTDSINLNTFRPIKDTSEHLRWDVTILYTSRHHIGKTILPCNLSVRVEYCTHNSLTAWVESIYDATCVVVPDKYAEHTIPISMVQDIYTIKVHPKCNINPHNLPQFPFHVEVLEGEFEGEIMEATRNMNHKFFSVLGESHDGGPNINPPYYVIRLTSEKFGVQECPLQNLKVLE